MNWFYFKLGILFSLGITSSVNIGWPVCIILVKITHSQISLESSLEKRDTIHFRNYDNSINLPRHWICMAQHHLIMNIWGTISYICSIAEKYIESHPIFKQVKKNREKYVVIYLVVSHRNTQMFILLFYSL